MVMESNTTTKRQKKVFSSMSDIAHIFSNEPGREARFRNGFIEGDVIYSYGRHFPIARRHVDGAKTTMFVTLRSYSNTTRKHIDDVKYAIRQHTRLYMYFLPAYGEPNHTANIDYWTKEIENFISKFKKAKTNKYYILTRIRDNSHRLKMYLQFFKIKPAKEVEQILEEVASDKWEKEIDEHNKKRKERLLDPKLEEKREKARLARERAEIKKNEEQIQKWRNFEPYVYRPYSYKHSHNLPDLLRYNVEKQRIQTSQKVEIPVEVAHKFYRYIQVMLKKGGCTSEACCDYNLLDKYRVREITNVHIVVGCHRIKQEEINNMAKQLKWI
jgi:hypothetical protein